MGTHPIFESDFDCLTEVIGESNTANMSEQIPVEFEEEVDSKSDHSFESVNSSGSNADNEGADDSVESIDPFDMICGDDMARGESKRPEPESTESAVVAEPEPESIEEIDPFDMICGDDISRLPDVGNPNEKKPETIEEVAEEKPSYAAVARSRPTSECNDNELVEDPIVEDVVEEPVQAAAPSVSATPKVEAAQPEAETEGKQSRAERKTKKAMMKLGLAPVEGINRVVLRKDKTLLFVVPNPEVFRKGDTWVSWEKHALKIQTKEQEKWPLLKLLKISNQKPRLNQFKQQSPKKTKKLMFQLTVLKKKTLSWLCNKLLVLAPKPFPPLNRTPMISSTLSWSSPFDSGQMTHTDDTSVMTHVLGRLPIYLCMLF